MTKPRSACSSAPARDRRVTVVREAAGMDSTSSSWRRQHATYEMDTVFFHDLRLPDPTSSSSRRARAAAHAGPPAGAHDGRRRGRADEGAPDVALVPSDPQLDPRRAIVAARLGLHVGHVESGLRSHDSTMPESWSRIVTGPYLDLSFAPDRALSEILRREGSRGPSACTPQGIRSWSRSINTRALPRRKSSILEDLRSYADRYILVTSIAPRPRLADTARGHSRWH